MKTGFHPSPATLCNGSASQEQQASFFSPFCKLLFPLPLWSQTEAAGKTLIFEEESEMVVRNCAFQPPSSFSFFRKQNLTHSYAAAAAQEPPASQGSAVPPRRLSPAVLRRCVQGLHTSPPTGDTFHQWPPDLIKEGPPFLSESVVMLQMLWTCRERQE